MIRAKANDYLYDDFRNSLLTFFFRSNFKSKCNLDALLIATVNPKMSSKYSTYNTIKFAQSTMKVKTIMEQN